MGAFTALATAFAQMTLPPAIATGLSIAGTVRGFQGAEQQEEAGRRAEALRAQQARLEQARRSREIYRQAQMARANAVSASTARGSVDSTALQAALGSIQNQSGAQQLALAENAGIGNQLFEANTQMAEAGGMIAEGNSLGQLGRTITGLRPELDRVTNNGWNPIIERAG